MDLDQKMKAYQGGSTGGDSSNIPEPGNPTYTEAWALVEAARRMAAVIQYGDLTKIEDKKRLRDAVRLNWRLWTIFQAELTVGESRNHTDISEDLRMDMLTLCKFVDNHTIGLITDPTIEKVATLIDLNRNIAQGLLASLQASASESQQEGTEQGDAAEFETVGESI